MLEADNDLCSEKAALLETISFSVSSVVQRTWREHTVIDTQKAGNLLWYSQALDKSTDLSSMS